MKYYPMLQAIGSAALSVAFSWMILTLMGVRQFLEKLTIKWDLGWYQPVFLVLLTLVAAVYFAWRRSGAFIKNFLFGGIAGVLVGWLAMLLSSLLQFGAEGFARGIKIAGVSYLLLVAGAAFFPLCSWLYGAIAIGCGGFFEKYIFSRVDPCRGSKNQGNGEH